MRNLIVSFAILSLPYLALCQQHDTLWFSKEKTYSRCLVQYKNELLIGTSKTGLLAYDLKKGTTRTILKNLHNEEIRDVLVVQNKAYALFSGDHGFVYEIDLKRNSNRLILADSNTFLDDIATNGIDLMILGDPKNGHFYLRKYNFKTQLIQDLDIKIPAEENEACYAASGTTGQYIDKLNYYFISGGGKNSRLHKITFGSVETWYQIEILPMKSAAGAGPFCMNITNHMSFIGGGNYQNFKDTTGTVSFKRDFKANFESFACPGGYRSSAIFFKEQFYTCGTSGLYAFDPIRFSWDSILIGNFCALYHTKKILYATSNKGFLIRIKY